MTFEVIRHKLWSIGDEQSITLKSVSGSPVVTESSDFNNGIYLADGSIVIFGRQVLLHAGTMSLVLKSVIQDCEDEPGINEGDMFITNDPYKGAVHLPDVTIVAPFFYKGELVAWFGSCAHQLDVGGMEFGSWCPKATERFQEGLTLPPLKIVERGKIRTDILNMILSNSRLPYLVGLDMRALIASNNVARIRFETIISRYGFEEVKEVMEGLLNLSESKLRQRLKNLPDGVFRAQDFIDHDGYENLLYKIALTMTKEEDNLTFDFSGSSKQAPSSINCSESTMIGGTLSALLTILAYDIPWNQGLTRPLRFIAPKGIICNAESPAPVGSAPMAASWSVQTTAISAISRLVACSDELRRESIAISQGALPILNLRGLNQSGEPFGTMFLDAKGGSGATAFRDGLDWGGRSTPVPSITNVEANENFASVLYLYRRMIRDSAGPGQHRGGRGAGFAITPHDTDILDAVLVSHGVEVPNAMGAFGGFPGSCNKNTLVRNSEIFDRQREQRLPSSCAELKGENIDLGAKPGRFYLKRGDVFEYTLQGGGGYGSPLEREPESVLRDFINGAVSAECAGQLYGVVIDPQRMKISKDKTLKLRKEKSEKTALKARQSFIQKQREGAVNKILQIGPYLELVEINGGKMVSCRCGYQLGHVSENWKNGTLRLVVPAKFAGPLVKLHQELEISLYLCPNCFLMHSMDVAKKGQPPLWETELKL